jgi:ribonuclease HI/endonuclease/exonuclease/phosphatase (EEP) superfamily protein YafD
MPSGPSPPPRPSRPSYSSISVIQHNTNRQEAANLSILEQALEQGTDLILLQEPHLYKIDNSFIPIQHPAYNLITPIPSTSFPKLARRPRVIAYKRKESLFEASPSFDLFCDPDIQAIRVEGTEPFTLINLYNEKEVIEAPASQQRPYTVRAPASQPGPYTVERLLLTAQLPQQPFLLAGDFNLHHPRWNPSVEASKARKAEALVSWLDRYKASLLTDLEVATEGTYWREGLKGVSLIDLAFYSPFKQLTWTNFRFLDATGSDHKPIAFEASPRGPNRPLAARPATYNYKKADWKVFSKHLAKKEQDLLIAIERAITRDNLEGIASLLTRTLTEASNAAIPKKRPYEGSKPWWTDELTSLRKALGLAQRAHRLLRDEESHETFLEARNSFKYAIRAAKKKHWESFLAEAVGKDVFTAFSYTKARANPTLPSLSYKKGGVEAKANTFTEKCEAFLTTLFPTPDSSPGPSPPSPPQSLETEPPGCSGSKGKARWDWPELEDPEIRRAIVSSSNKKAAGPDSLSFLPIQYAYKAIPTVFNRAYKALFNRGYHPKAWKEAIGIILPKLDKPDYSVPKAYRVISLLNCLGKTLEKLYATRLSYLANTTGLLSPSQLGGRKQRSAIDTALLLLHHIQKKQESNKKAITSTLLLDIKGAFDYVSKEQLIRVLEGLGLPRALISWVGHFLTGRKIQLAFEGQIQPLTDLATGVPQGSPISPILFLLYVRGILATQGYQLSYMDDFSISITSTSAKKNIRQLEAIASSLFEQAEGQKVQFDPSKTELIHFSRQKQPILEGIQVGGLFFKAKTLVRWLGIFFDNRLLFKDHIDTKVRAAQAAFEGLSRLVSMQRGLSFRASRQLYQACVTTIADYGVQLWYRGPKTPRSLIKPFQRLQNQALLKILGAFKGSPIRALEAEAALPPPEVRFKKACLSYALRTLYLLPSHPTRQAYNLAVRDELADSGSDLGSLSYIRPYTQLFHLLKELVAVIGPNYSLERKKASWEAPWALEPKTSITVIEASKPLAKKQHLRLLASLASLEDFGLRPLVFYTDGSKGRPKGSFTETNACAFCELSPENRPKKVYYENLGPSVEVADAELFAILRVLEDLARRPRPPSPSPPNPPLGAYIFIDSQAAIAKVRKHSDLAIRVRRLLASLGTLYTVQLHWCPSHLGIFGNELADQLAKKGLGAPLKGTPIVSISYLRRKTREATRDLWNGLWAAETAKGPRAKGLGRHYRSIRKTPRLVFSPGKDLIRPRPTLSAFFQLLFGAGFFLSFLKKIKKIDRDNCRCGYGSHTPGHLILKCPNYKKERGVLYRAFQGRKEALSLTFLYSSKEGREALLTFLAKTEIGTAKWLENE